MAPLCVSNKDRNKFSGSLPNHLDDVENPLDDNSCKYNIYLLLYTI